MANKNIIVLLKIFKGDLNPFDETALETALRLKEEYDVTVLAMAPLAFQDILKNLTRLGCKAILLSDMGYAQSDTIATANILSALLKRLNPELIFAGRKSMDGDTAQVPMMLSELLGYRLVNRVINEENGLLKLRNGQTERLEDHTIITFEKFRPLRSPSIFSKVSDVEVMTNDDLNLPKERIGLLGSRTKVVRSYQNEEDKRFVTFINYEQLDEVIARELNKENKDVSAQLRQQIPLIYYVGDIEDVAKRYAKEVSHLAIEDKTTDEAINVIKDKDIKIILWEEADKIKELACRVAIKLDVGLCADCTNIKEENGEIVITRPALSGDVMADIVCTSKIAMATIRKSQSESNVAITVGKGAIDYLPQIQKLADKYQAEIYCSRPLADSGLMDYSKQVGLTGRSINPKICIVIGVSGAVQHIVGINKSKTIIAININKKEKIYDYVNYGIVMDAKDI